MYIDRTLDIKKSRNEAAFREKIRDRGQTVNCERRLRTVVSSSIVKTRKSRIVAESAVPRTAVRLDVVAVNLANMLARTT